MSIYFFPAQLLFFLEKEYDNKKKRVYKKQVQGILSQTEQEINKTKTEKEAKLI